MRLQLHTSKKGEISGKYQLEEAITVLSSGKGV